jgi:hypothetical protein
VGELTSVSVLMHTQTTKHGRIFVKPFEEREISGSHGDEYEYNQLTFEEQPVSNTN